MKPSPAATTVEVISRAAANAALIALTTVVIEALAFSKITTTELATMSAPALITAHVSPAILEMS